MKKETKDDIRAGGIGVVLVLVIVWALVGCTHTIYDSPLDAPQQSMTPYRYYVIDEHSDIPDAYFETKEEAEKYKIYFKENHNYKVVQLQ